MKLPAEIRERILARDGFRCSGRFIGGECSAVLDVHHIRPREEGGTDEDSNLMTLCHRHHPMLEALRRAILKRKSSRWKHCHHHHPYPGGREECERRLNDGLVASS